MRTPIVLCCACLLSACSPSLSPSQIEPPAAVLLAPSPKLQEVKEGDDLVRKHVELRRQYLTEVGKYRRLQKWANTVLKR